MFHSATGAQGKLGRPSKQQLDSVFGTHTDTDVVTAILEKGQLVGTGTYSDDAWHLSLIHI